MQGVQLRAHQEKDKSLHVFLQRRQFLKIGAVLELGRTKEPLEGFCYPPLVAVGPSILSCPSPPPGFRLTVDFFFFGSVLKSAGLGGLGFPVPSPWRAQPGQWVTQAFLNERCSSPVTSAAWPWIPTVFSKMITKPKKKPPALISQGPGRDAGL